MGPTIGANLRVTGHCNQGDRKYMEDVFCVAYQQTEDSKGLEYAFFGIYDGHGGREAAHFAKEHLMDMIVSQKNFWEDNDESVLKAIREGFIQTHAAMWKEIEKWPRTPLGLPSTSGTTASVAFIRRGKIYIGHVGDSAIILGAQDPNSDEWVPIPLTQDHKPESEVEKSRIENAGGKVQLKSGVPRVVWSRPVLGHEGPVRRSTTITEIPFLAVARSLGDLWSYNSDKDTYVVSPEPDVQCFKIDLRKHRVIILGTDGLWNALPMKIAMNLVKNTEKHNEQQMREKAETGKASTFWINPAKRLVDHAIYRWNSMKLRADNTSCVTVMLDPPGPPKSEVIRAECRARRSLLDAQSPPGPVPLSPSGRLIALAFLPQPSYPAPSFPAPMGNSPVQTSSSPFFSAPSRARPVTRLQQQQISSSSSQPPASSAPSLPPSASTPAPAAVNSAGDGPRNRGRIHRVSGSMFLRMSNGTTNSPGGSPSGNNESPADQPSPAPAPLVPLQQSTSLRISTRRHPLSSTNANPPASATTSAKADATRDGGAGDQENHHADRSASIGGRSHRRQLSGDHKSALCAGLQSSAPVTRRGKVVGLACTLRSASQRPLRQPSRKELTPARGGGASVPAGPALRGRRKRASTSDLVKDATKSPRMISPSLPQPSAVRTRSLRSHSTRPSATHPPTGGGV
ncbi:unnamed protein product [Cyprideis torosa]|uniref:Uncharacterized protein n=1 Tax=Cyprideis torosa TaxID=163714 RepID=A0A7R8ZK01_9CRUS|nr:unnamed protein product [Cyprideis torosa]CAG0888268.1 unnamed protein product [Cyprideis torosa]